LLVLCNTQVDGVLKSYIHEENTYRDICDLMNKEMDKGLSRTENADAAVKMFITYVQSLPDGSGYCSLTLCRYFAIINDSSALLIRWRRHFI